MKIGESKVSQRGSVVIPKAIREALNVTDGKFVEWHIIQTMTVDAKSGQTVTVKKKEGLE